MRKIFVLILISAVISSCSNKVENVEKAFYYWKSDSYGMSDKQESIISQLKTKKLYIKFFEVEYNNVMGNIPISKTNMYFQTDKKSYMDSITLVPTIYLENEVFLKSSKQELDSLVTNMNALIAKYSKEKFHREDKITELQMDCDWTLKSKENYFYFLKKIKRISHKKISCTLRLYPYKYPEKMGIPPVDKVMLMCYNLINPMINKEKNSILDPEELSLYLNKKRKYPLHLDIALPIYNWMHVFQNNRFRCVIYPKNASVKHVLKPIRPLWFEVIKDTVINDVFLRAGDNVKYEEITAAKIEDAVRIIKKNVVFDKNITVALFHLDENQLDNYSHESISHFYSDFIN